jgi:hypothetical protein
VVAQVDQPHSPRQDPAQVVGEPTRGRGDVGEDVGQGGVRVVGPQQVRGHPVRHAQATGEERALRLLDGHEQVLHQRRARGQPPAGGGCGRPGGADLQGQPDRGPAPGDVVVGEVEPAERVVGRGVVAAPVFDHRAHSRLDQRDPREQVPEADTRPGCVG